MEILQRHLQNPKGVGVVVIQNNKVLLGKRTDSSEWGLAGGGIEKGETPKEAAVRELFEEFGIVEDNLKYYGISYSPPNPFKPSDNQEGCSVDFFVEYDKDKFIDVVVPEREMTEFKWFSLDEVLSEATLYPSSRHSLELFLRV